MAALLVVLAGMAFAGEPMRVVCVGGAHTETVFAIGAESRLVGVDITSTFPEAARKLPQVGYQRALSVEGIASLRPDLVILPASAGPPAVIRQLQDLNLPLLRLEEGHSIEAAARRIRQIGGALGHEREAEELASALESDAAEIVPAPSPAPRVLFVMSAGGRAPMVGGSRTAADAAIRLAGGTNVAAGFSGYKQLSPEALVTLAPEVVVTTSRTVAANDSASTPAELIPGLEFTPAGASKRLVVMDDMYLLGFGPRAGQAIAELARKLAESRLRAAR